MEKKFINILADCFKDATYEVRVDVQPKPPLKDSEYECAWCHEINEKGWSDEESHAEAEAIFGKPVSEWKDEAVVICDDCFQKMHPLKAENADKLLRATEQN
jgi:hypothetical protein